MSESVQLTRELIAIVRVADDGVQTEYEEDLLCTKTGQVSTSLGGETPSTFNKFGERQEGAKKQPKIIHRRIGVARDVGAGELGFISDSTDRTYDGLNCASG